MFKAYFPVLLFWCSPEAAAVLLDGWAEAGKPSGLQVASVGSSTSTVLANGGLAPVFEATKATAATLAKEIPPPSPSGADGSGLARIFYPASAKATTILQDGLAARGYTIIADQLMTLDSWGLYCNLTGRRHCVLFATACG